MYETFTRLHVTYKDFVAQVTREYASVWPDPEAEWEDLQQVAWLKIWTALLAGYVVESDSFVETLVRQACRDYNRDYDADAPLELIGSAELEKAFGEDDELGASLETEAALKFDVTLDAPDLELEAAEVVWGLDCALTRMERKVLQFRYIEGHDDSKVAALLDTTEGVVRELSRLIRNKAATLAAGVDSPRKAKPYTVYPNPYRRIDVYNDSYGPSAIGRQVPNESVFPFATEEM